MPDLTITAGSVAQITTPVGNQIATVTARGTVGGTISITPGQVVYADPSANNQLKLAQASIAFQSANVVGIALGSAAPNQPLTYAVSGDIQLATTAPVTLTSGSAYVLSINPGNLISVLDPLAAGNFVTVIGVGNGTAAGTPTSVFRLNLIAGAAQK